MSGELIAKRDTAKRGIRSATIAIVPKDSALLNNDPPKKKIEIITGTKKKQTRHPKGSSMDIRKFFGMSTLDDKSNILVPVKPGKIIYERKHFDLGDGAKCTYIPGYVRNPDALFNELKEKIPWAVYTFESYEREVQSPRLISVIHFDRDDVSDFPELNKIKARVEKFTKLTFKYAVLNYYRDGQDYIAYHSDRENEAGNTIVSVTVGGTRRFILKHKFRDGVKHEFLLKHGDVLILNDGAINKIYRHGLPKMAGAKPRINVTLRE